MRAASTPEPHTVEIIDEVFGFEATDPQVRRCRYYLVALTSYSSGASRAYEIADQCRAAGIPIVEFMVNLDALQGRIFLVCLPLKIAECDAAPARVIALKFSEP